MSSINNMEDHPEYIVTQRKDEYGETFYLVKWIGCDVDDKTWESEDKLQTEWPKALLKYKQEQREKRNGKAEKPRKKPQFSPEEVFAYTKSVSNWESEVDQIRYMERSKVPGFMVYIDWKNGFKSVHHSTEVYAKCPQKMIEYFERYLKFKEIFLTDD